MENPNADVTLEGGSHTIADPSNGFGSHPTLSIYTGRFTLASGTVSAEESQAILVSNDGDTNSSFTMTSGTLRSQDGCALFANSANITINGGTLTGYCGASFNNSNVTITDGTFTGGSYGVELTTTATPSGTPKINATISGGTFTGNETIGTAGLYVKLDATDPGSSVSISGGKFSKIDNANGDANALLAPGCTLNPDGTVTAPTPVATVTTANGTTTPYTDLAAAWTAACNAGAPATITLCSDVTLTESLRMPQGNVTLVGGGYTITSPENVSPIYIDGGTFTLQSGTILAPGDDNDAISIDKPGNVSVIVNGGTLKGGSATGGGLYAGNDFKQNVSVTINGGIFSGSYGAKLVDCTKAEIKGGTFTGTKNGLDVTFTGTGHTVTISGGTFSSIQNATANGTVKDLLAPGFTFYSGDAELDTSKPTLIPPTGQTLTPVTRRPFDMDFTDAAGDEGDLDRDGYHWDNTNKTLTLKDFTYTGDIILPTEKNITINTQSPSTLTGNIKFGDDYTALPFHVTFESQDNASLTVTGKIGDCRDNSTLTIAQGAVVNANGGVEVSGQGLISGVLTVSGTLNAASGVDNPAATAGKVIIKSTGSLNVSGSRGVKVGGVSGDDPSGSFTMEGGTFTGSCTDYNIAYTYFNGAMPDTFDTNQIISLPDHYLPAGYEIKIVNNQAVLVAASSQNPTWSGPDLVGAGGTLTLTKHDPHTVSVTITGQGTVDVSAKTKLRDEKSFYEGETVALTATPAEGYHLDSLTATQNGSTVTLTSEGSGAYTFEMPDADVTVTAVFLADPKPSDPSDPSGPSDPDPSKPENPSDPSKPENPTNPSNPENPTKPSNPENPTKPETKPETKPTKPTTPAKPGKTPGTGDTSNILFWTILMLLTFTTAATLLFQTRRRHSR